MVVPKFILVHWTSLKEGKILCCDFNDFRDVPFKRRTNVTREVNCFVSTVEICEYFDRGEDSEKRNPIYREELKQKYAVPVDPTPRSGEFEDAYLIKDWVFYDVTLPEDDNNLALRFLKEAGTPPPMPEEVWYFWVYLCYNELQVYLDYSWNHEFEFFMDDESREELFNYLNLNPDTKKFITMNLDSCRIGAALKKNKDMYKEHYYERNTKAHHEICVVYEDFCKHRYWSYFCYYIMCKNLRPKKKIKKYVNKNFGGCFPRFIQGIYESYGSYPTYILDYPELVDIFAEGVKGKKKSEISGKEDNEADVDIENEKIIDEIGPESKVERDLKMFGKSDKNLETSVTNTDFTNSSMQINTTASTCRSIGDTSLETNTNDTFNSSYTTSVGTNSAIDNSITSCVTTDTDQTILRNLSHDEDLSENEDTNSSAGDDISSLDKSNSSNFESASSKTSQDDSLLEVSTILGFENIAKPLSDLETESSCSNESTDQTLDVSQADQDTSLRNCKDLKNDLNKVIKTDVNSDQNDSDKSDGDITDGNSIVIGKECCYQNKEKESDSEVDIASEMNDSVKIDDNKILNGGIKAEEEKDEFQKESPKDLVSTITMDLKESDTNKCALNDNKPDEKGCKRTISDEINEKPDRDKDITIEKTEESENLENKESNEPKRKKMKWEGGKKILSNVGTICEFLKSNDFKENDYCFSDIVREKFEVLEINGVNREELFADLNHEYIIVDTINDTPIQFRRERFGFGPNKQYLIFKPIEKSDEPEFSCVESSKKIHLSKKTTQELEKKSVCPKSTWKDTIVNAISSIAEISFAGLVLLIPYSFYSFKDTVMEAIGNGMIYKVKGALKSDKDDNSLASSKNMYNQYLLEQDEERRVHVEAYHKRQNEHFSNFFSDFYWQDHIFPFLLNNQMTFKLKERPLVERLHYREIYKINYGHKAHGLDINPTNFPWLFLPERTSFSGRVSPILEQIYGTEIIFDEDGNPCEVTNPNTDGPARKHVVFDENGDTAYSSVKYVKPEPESKEETETPTNYFEIVSPDDWDSVKQNYTLPRKEIYDESDIPADLPEELRKYWSQRHRFFILFDKGIKMDYESWFSVTPEMLAAHHATRCKSDVVVDAFCGAGGNAIQLAMTCSRVIAIDIDPEKIKIARHNAKVYGVQDKITFIQGSYMDVMENIKFPVNTVFLSPPWGGIEYQQQECFDIYRLDGNLNCKTLVEIARKHTKNIAIYLPKNSNFMQMLSLAENRSEIDIEFNCYSSKVKAITAYYGNLANYSVD